MSKSTSFIGRLPTGHPDPNGDVVLLLHTQEPIETKRAKDGKPLAKKARTTAPKDRSLRVSSKVLSLASPVFTAMFGSRFMTDGGLSVVDPPEIPLPDDDLEAITLLCFALHCHGLSDIAVPATLLQGLAIICDRYDCAVAIQAWTRLWLQSLEEDYLEDRQRYWDLLWMSYAFKEHTSFWKASKALIYGPDIPMPSSVGFDILPPTLPGMIMSLRIRAQLNLHKTMDLLTSGYISARQDCPKRIRVGLLPQCHYNLRLEHYSRQLSQLRLWPITRVAQNEGVGTYLKRLRGYRPYEQHGSSCRCLNNKFEDYIPYIIDELEKKSFGLCITGVRAGKLAAHIDSFSADEGFIDLSTTSCQLGHTSVKLVGVIRIQSAKRKKEGLPHGAGRDNCMTPSGSQCKCKVSEM